MKPRVAVYTRISKDQHAGEGVARQEALCRDRAEREGWDVVGTFTDNDISASTRSRKPRPKYDAMLSAARAGEIDGILCYSLSRLTRRPKEWETLIELAEETGLRVWSLSSGDPDLSKADGRAMARTIAAWDSAEAERTSERVRDQQAARRAEGNVRTRRAFGWGVRGVRVVRVDGESVEVEGIIPSDDLWAEEADPLRNAMYDVLKGKSSSEIAREWNAQGVRSVTGAPWTQARVGEVLTRWRNAGVVVHRGDPVEGVQGRWEPVCDRSTLERVRTILLDPGRRTMTPGRPPTALMSSTAKCGKCGRHLVASKAKSRDGLERFMYRCSAALSTTGGKHYLGIERKTLDKAVRDEVRNILAFSSPAGLVPTSEDRGALIELQERRSALSEEEHELGRLMGSGNLSVAFLRVALEGVQSRREGLDMEIQAIRDRSLFSDLFVEVLQGTRVSLQGVAAIGERFEALTITQQRQIVKTLLRVTVHPGRGAERIEIERLKA